MKNVPCPVCDDEDGLVAITYAYHAVRDDPQFGPQLDHVDWSEEWALLCNSCGWEHGNSALPDRHASIEEVIKQAKIDHIRKEFIKEMSS